jgi:hypothetical protein
LSNTLTLPCVYILVHVSVYILYTSNDHTFFQTYNNELCMQPKAQIYLFLSFNGPL